MGESIDLYHMTTDFFEIEEVDLATYSPLTLAYIGDAVYEIVIRTIIVTKDGNSQVNKAKKHIKIIKLKMEKLTDDEIRIYKRGRNAKSFTSAKNASIGDYRTATGFEALMGYLYMSGKTERMLELVKNGLEKLEWRNV